MMQSVTTPKKMAISFKVITFFKSIASGNDSPTTPIIKAIAVPKWNSFCNQYLNYWEVCLMRLSTLVQPK